MELIIQVAVTREASIPPAQQPLQHPADVLRLRPAEVRLIRRLGDRDDQRPAVIRPFAEEEQVTLLLPPGDDLRRPAPVHEGPARAVHVAFRPLPHPGRPADAAGVVVKRKGRRELLFVKRVAGERRVHRRLVFPVQHPQEHLQTAAHRLRIVLVAGEDPVAGGIGDAHAPGPDIDTVPVGLAHDRFMGDDFLGDPGGDPVRHCRISSVSGVWRADKIWARLNSSHTKAVLLRCECEMGVSCPRLTRAFKAQAASVFCKHMPITYVPWADPY